MTSKSKRIILIAGLAICISGGLFFFFQSKSINTIYNSTIQNTAFENIVFEKDSTTPSNLPQKSLSEDSTHSSFTNTSHKNKIKTNNKAAAVTSSDVITADPEINMPATQPITGRELSAKNFKTPYTANTRIRLTTFINTFKEGDFLPGKEFAMLYKNDPSLNKVSKSTICSFIEKNIHHITRTGNSLVVYTTEESGIHTRIKIPFVEDLQINIDNGASIDVGTAFSSTEPSFLKSILLPVRLNKIDIVHNGELFPKKGYISGDYYFINYSQSKTAYKIR
jgi:hypothetical protein